MMCLKIVICTWVYFRQGSTICEIFCRFRIENCDGRQVSRNTI